MKVIKTPQVDLGPQAIIAVIGAFDGMHLGHRQLFKTAFEIKAETGLPVVAVTFEPHPKRLLRPGDEYRVLLSPLEEKIVFVGAMGVDYLWAIPFTPDVSRLSPREFVTVYLCTLMKARYVVCGFNFSFGHKGEGTPGHLSQIGLKHGFEVKVVLPYAVDGNVVSSTEIRRMLSRGDVWGASLLLGRHYCLCGDVLVEPSDKEEGATAYILDIPQDKLLPKDGVYQAKVEIPGRKAVLGKVALGEGRRPRVCIPNHDGGVRPKSMQVLLMKYIKN